MSDIKNIEKILYKISKEFKTEYGLALSVLIYAPLYTRYNVEAEVKNRSKLFYNEGNNKLINNTMIVVDELLDKIQKIYGHDTNITYDRNQFNDSYKLLADICKGSAMINSLYSKEYKNMDSKNSGSNYRNRISKILNEVNKNIYEKDSENLDKIVISESKYLEKLKTINVGDGSKLVNYDNTVYIWKTPYIKKEGKEIKVDNSSIKNTANEKTRVLSSFNVIKQKDGANNNQFKGEKRITIQPKVEFEDDNPRLMPETINPKPWRLFLFKHARFLFEKDYEVKNNKILNNDDKINQDFLENYKKKEIDTSNDIINFISNKANNEKEDILSKLNRLSKETNNTIQRTWKKVTKFKNN